MTTQQRLVRANHIQHEPTEEGAAAAAYIQQMQRVNGDAVRSRRGSTAGPALQIICLVSSARPDVVTKTLQGSSTGVRV